MRTTNLRGAGRLALTLVIGAGTLVGAGVLAPSALAASASSSHANSGPQNRLNLAKTHSATRGLAAVVPCVDTTSAVVACPTVVSVTTPGSPFVRGSKTAPVAFTVVTVVDDPANISVGVETLLGRGLDQAVPTLLVSNYFFTTTFTAVGTRKTYTQTVSSPYLPIKPVGAAPAYGEFQINPVVWGVDPSQVMPNSNQRLADLIGVFTIKAASAITNTPSATTVHRAQYFTESGRLTRFDGSGQAGQKVNIYYVPAGTTRASFAGTATTSASGAFSLRVRSWLTGSWFVNHPVSAESTGIYKSVWIKVIP
jgi:hypothetical protein